MATASGRPMLIAVIQQLSSNIILLFGLDVISLLKYLFMVRVDIITNGIEQTPAERQTLEIAVSCTAYFAAILEIPTFSHSFKFSF